MAPNLDRRRTLKMLAASRDGCAEPVLLALGFTVKQMAKLVRGGLATSTVVAGERSVGVALLRITEAGRRMLEQGR
jgi:hypothetical protein